MILVDEEVKEGVEVVEEHDDFRRLDPGADGGEADDVAEQHRHGRKHLARVQRAFAAPTIFSVKNILIDCIDDALTCVSSST